MKDKPKCRTCGKTDDMIIMNYSIKKKIEFWNCMSCKIETKVKIDEQKN